MEGPLTDAELVILSLIYEQPLHGYEIEQRINQRNMRAWTDLSTSSIYYVLQRLEHKAFIKKTIPSEPEKGVPRKSFQITTAGEKIWKEATLNALSRPRITHTNFLMGLHNLWNIEPTEALNAVRNYRDWLQNDLRRQRNELDQLGTSFFPLDVLFEYGFVIGEAELSFLSDLINRLQILAKEP